MKNLKMKVARMEKGLSQIELAAKVGVTRQTIGMIEAGDYLSLIHIEMCIRDSVPDRWPSQTHP